MKSSIPPDTLPGLPVAVPYRWRDPARLTPERLAELAAHDEHIAMLERASHAPAPDPRPPHLRTSEGRQAEFARLADAGLDVAAIAGEMGITTSTALRYERYRRARLGSFPPARYAELRDEGVSVSECARRMCVSRRQCQRWERDRERTAGQP